jgi:hypothetical protein
LIAFIVCSWITPSMGPGLNPAASSARWISRSFSGVALVAHRIERHSTDGSLTFTVGKTPVLTGAEARAFLDSACAIALSSP